MRVEIVERKLFSFDELSDEAKEKVFDYFRETQETDFEWECIQDDAKENADFILTSVSDNPISGEGKFKNDAVTTADRIMANCGESCDIYSVAEAFLAERDEAVDTAPKDENGDFEDESALDEKLDDIENDFESNVAHEFGKMWNNQLEYLASEEAIKETIEANEYEFTENGKLA